MKKKILKYTLDLFVITVGSGLFAISIALMLAPYGIASGGVSGIAILLCELYPKLPLGVVIIVLNAPLFLLSRRLFGRKFLLYSVYGTLVSSLLIDLAAALLHPIEAEPLLTCVFGGLLMGAGLGLVFTKNATTGGTDIIARLLKLPFPGMQIGWLLLAVDGCIIIASGFVFGSVNNMLYAAITLFISTRAIDGILYGLNVERIAFIISDNIPAIVRSISEDLQRGATLLHGEGSYTGEERKIILCAVKRQQAAELKRLVKKADPNAFLIMTEANEVLGNGFGDYERNA